MITAAFINLAYLLVSGFIEILPVSTGFSAEVHTAATSLGGYLGILDPIIPISTLAAALTIVFSVEIGIFGWKTIKSLVAHIPWIGGHGH